MISVSHLTLSYGNRALLSDFYASFAEGSITAIIGANGSGKSTLLAALAGDIAPIAGEVILNGKSIQEMSNKELAQVRSLAAQSHNYWMAYTSEEILRLGHDEINNQRFTDVIERLGISSYLKQRVTTLSGGELQRIEIARAFLRELPLILLDEPFASQDLASIEAMKRFFTDEKEAGRTIVIVAHLRREDLTWCDQIIDIGAK
jgi:ABC-type cobalamin/Fe3+-siderophores transport system ATPase subunit